MERALFWHQGLFLQPQHLQLSSRYHEALDLPLKRYLQPHFWGVGHYRISDAALDNRRFELTEGGFLFPDMTYVEIPGNAVVEPRSFEAVWEKGSQRFNVYLGLRRFDAVGPNVTVVPDMSRLANEHSRWVTAEEGREVPDLHRDGPSAQVQQLTYLLEIFWESEKDRLLDYELIRIAELERDKDRVRRSDRYVPPCLTIGADPALLRIVKEIRDQIGARSHQLEEYKRDGALRSAGFTGGDRPYLLPLRSLVRHAALLEHLAGAGQAHPWTVFGLLCQLVAELSTFCPGISFNGESHGGAHKLPPYDHERLSDCFGSVQKLITRMLDEITAGPEFELELEFDGTYFSADDLPQSMFEGHRGFYLRMETDAEHEEIRVALKSIAKLACRESLPTMIAKALPGVGMAYLEKPPQELPLRPGALYFKIDQNDKEWAGVRKHKNLAFYWDRPPEDLNMVLLVVGRG